MEKTPHENKTNNMKKYIVGLGEILWDVLPDGKQVGGAPGNFAYHASQFGFNGAVVSAVGKDKLGDELLDNIKDKGIGEFIQRVDYPTGTVQVTLDDNGIPNYEIREGVAWDNIEFTPAIKKLAKSCQAAVFGSLAQRSAVTRSTIYKFLDAMPEGEEQYKIYDINLRQGFYTKESIEESLQRCNVLKINDEELVAIGRIFTTSGIDLQDECWKLLEMYDLRMLILTCGVNGSYVFTKGNVSFVATPVVDVVDTVGAGDSFTSTFISSILKGRSVRNAHLLAVRVSAYVCTQHGAMPELPLNLKL